MHVQRMLNIIRVYTLTENLSKIVVRKTKENSGSYLRSWFDKLTIFIKFIMRSLLARLTPLHSENVD